MNTYSKLKQANPTLPILVREAESVKARLIARFGAYAHLIIFAEITHVESHCAD
jgi:hypothetical protein